MLGNDEGRSAFEEFYFSLKARVLTLSLSAHHQAQLGIKLMKLGVNLKLEGRNSLNKSLNFP